MDPRQIADQAFQEDSARRTKWAWLTKGIEEEAIKRGQSMDMAIRNRIVTEILLDTEEREVVKKKSGFMTETTTVSDVPNFTTFAFPLVRRVYPALIANELVSVQPMTGPTALIFYLDFKYDTQHGGGSSISAGARLDQTIGPSPAIDEYGNVAASASVPKLKTTVSQTTVTAEARKLGAKWQIEAQQDLQSQYGLDMESELLKVMGNEIAREIDRDIVTDIEAQATAGNVNWNSTVPGSGPYSTIDPKIWRETIYEAITDANNLIYKKRYRNASWLVADPDTCVRLEKLERFKLFDGADDSQFNIGIQRIGTLAGQYRVYKNPGMTANKILLGFRGNSFMETGYVYAPYIPAWVTPAFTDPDTLEISRGMMSRYAKKVVEGDCYSTVTITST